MLKPTASRTLAAVCYLFLIVLIVGGESSGNVIFVPALQFSQFLDHYSALITAIATAAIGYFTFTLKRSTDNLWNESKKQRTEAKLAV